jgi:hypothetical protein
MKIAIVGAAGGTHIGDSLRRAAIQAGMSTQFYDVRGAWGARGVMQALAWRLGGRRPLKLDEFSSGVVRSCELDPPEVVITTGAAPLTRTALSLLRALGATCVNFSTDDPWNRALRAGWFLDALPEYDVICTPRMANIEDFRRIGCADVRFLPFAYDPMTFSADLSADVAELDQPDVLFVGGADRDRFGFIKEFAAAGPRLTLVGGYWDRYPLPDARDLGLQPADVVMGLTLAAKVNLCLVRRANRDGHVMRSFEIAAVGGCMLAEDTAEHRLIFGEDEDCALFFKTPKQAASLAAELFGDTERRRQLAVAARARVVSGGHTYGDRLSAMLSAAQEARSSRDGRVELK